MSPFSWLCIVVSLAQNANRNFQPLVRCPHCGKYHCIIRYGYYLRSRYDKNIEGMQVPGMT